MAQYTGRPADRDRRSTDTRRQPVASSPTLHYTDRKAGGDPSKTNVRDSQRRIRWENDLYERQSE